MSLGGEEEWSAGTTKAEAEDKCSNFRDDFWALILGNCSTERKESSFFC
jgi:hypothetical protein